MNTLIAIVWSIFALFTIGLGLLYFVYKMQETTCWRIKRARARKLKDEESDFKIKMKYLKEVPDSEKEEVIKKLEDGERVKIPYASFDYIYRHIDDFGVVDKDGQIVLIKQ